MGVALVMRRRLEWLLDQIDVTYDAPETVIRGEDAKISISLYNPTSIALWGAHLSIRTPDGRSESAFIDLLPFEGGTLTAWLSCHHYNSGHIWGLELLGHDPFGLVTAERFVIQPYHIQIRPNSRIQTWPLDHHRLQATSVSDADHSLSRREIEGDFSELRHYQPSDGLKRVAWRASARFGQLLTRNYEQAIEQRYLFALDLSAIMRVPLGSTTRVDLSLDYLPHWIKSLQSVPCALAAFDHRVLYESKVEPAFQILNHLTSFSDYATRPLDADCVAETREELWARASEFLYWSGAAQTKKHPDLYPFTPSPFSTHPLTDPYRLEITSAYLDGSSVTPHTDWPLKLDEGEHDLIRRYCFQIGISCTPVLARPYHELESGLIDLIQHAERLRVNHLCILSHSRRLIGRQDLFALKTWIQSGKQLSWFQLGCLSKACPKMLIPLRPQLRYIAIPYPFEGSATLDFSLSSSLRWQ